MQRAEQLCYFIDWKEIAPGKSPAWLQERVHSDLISLRELDGENAEVFTACLERKYNASILRLYAVESETRLVKGLYDDKA